MKVKNKTKVKKKYVLCIALVNKWADWPSYADEMRNEPYTRPFKAELASIQAELIIIDAEDDFLDCFKLKSAEQSAATEFVSNADLYVAYRAFTEQNGERRKPSNTFHRKIKVIGMKAFKTRQGPNGDRGYKVSVETRRLLFEYQKQHVLILNG